VVKQSPYWDEIAGEQVKRLVHLLCFLANDDVYSKVFNNKQNRTYQNDRNAYINIDIVRVGDDTACEHGDS
jgi:hypothetical protein